jgi:hypothetical protein
VSRPVNLDAVVSPVSQSFGHSLHVRYPVVVEGPYTVGRSTVLHSLDAGFSSILVMLGRETRRTPSTEVVQRLLPVQQLTLHD